MGEKSALKKEYIVETAKKVFVEKGYKSVTMKDIVDACGISRGGLYLYFDSTAAVFEAVLETESGSVHKNTQEKLPSNFTPADFLSLFLKEQKKEILNKKDNLSVAIYEYLFENKIPKKDNYISKQFSACVKVAAKLIEACVNAGEIYCEEPLAAARNLMYVIEGLKIQANTCGVTESAIDKEFLYILSGMTTEE